MSSKHWLASYGDIPAEVDVRAFSSVTAMMEDAMRRFGGRDDVIPQRKGTVPYACRGIRMKITPSAFCTEANVRRGS